jgi:6-pyruvoyltetrahydropterin/6-carboxytetrahydropterin synthase
MFTIKKQFSFAASHQLCGLPPEHVCSRLHGHNYSVELSLRAAAVDEIGFVKDYRELEFVKKWIDENLDHRHLNDVLPFNPTAELIAQFLFINFMDELPQLTAVTVKETDKTSATYEPERN